MRVSGGGSGNAAEGVLPAILEDQRDGLPQALQRLIARAALAVRSGDVEGVGEVPVAVSLEDRAELSFHRCRVAAETPPRAIRLGGLPLMTRVTIDFRDDT